MDVCPSNTTECLLRAIFNAQKCVPLYVELIGHTRLTIRPQPQWLEWLQLEPSNIWCNGSYRCLGAHRRSNNSLSRSTECRTRETESLEMCDWAGLPFENKDRIQLDRTTFSNDSTDTIHRSCGMVQSARLCAANAKFTLPEIRVLWCRVAQSYQPDPRRMSAVVINSLSNRLSSQ